MRLACESAAASHSCALQGFILSCARIAFVKVLFKTLLIWCMLLVVPLQGYAAATTLLCAPIKTASAATGPQQASAPAHDHQAMLLAGHADHLYAAGAGLSAHDAEPGEQASPNHDAGGQCDACSACCLGAAMAASFAPRMSAETQQCTFVLLDALVAPAVDLALPERPPQALLT